MRASLAWLGSVVLAASPCLALVSLPLLAFNPLVSALDLRCVDVGKRERKRVQKVHFLMT